MKFDLKNIDSIIQNVGLEGFILLLVIFFLFVAIRLILKQNAKRIDNLESLVNDLKGVCKNLKKDIDNAHAEKRALLKEINNLKMRCDKLNFQLDQSLQREQVLSRLFEHLKDGWSIDASVQR